MYGQHATDIIAYTYQAANHCPDCIGNAFRGLPTMMALNFTATERILDVAASERSIDRYDESSYDSGDFPKVVFASDLDKFEHCDTCEDCLGHDLRDCESTEDDSDV